MGNIETINDEANIGDIPTETTNKDSELRKVCTDFRSIDIKNENGTLTPYHIYIKPPSNKDKNKDLAFGYSPADNPDDITLLEIMPENILFPSVTYLQNLPWWDPTFVGGLISIGDELKKDVEKEYEKDPNELKLIDMQKKIKINGQRYIVNLKPDKQVGVINLYQEYLKRLKRRKY